MIWEALIGGAVGGLLGGPLGMTAGAALGASWDVLRNREAPPLDANMTARHGQDGIFLEAHLVEAIEGGQVLLLARGPDGRSLGAQVPRFADDKRQFQLSTVVKDSRVQCFVPYGTIETRGLQEIAFVMRVFLTPTASDLDIQGEETLRLTWPDKPYVAAHFWRPMLGLCMAVARADGQVDRVEVQVVRDRVAAGLKIPASEQEQVTNIMRQEPTQPLEPQLLELQRRVPTLRPAALLSALADVAHANQDIHDAEVAIIVEIARLLGIQGSQWRTLAQQLRLDGIDHLAHYRRLLQIPATAPPQEVEAAYAKQMARYDPERVAGLAEDLQELAWRQTTALHRARAALLKANTLES